MDQPRRIIHPHVGLDDARFGMTPEGRGNINVLFPEQGFLITGFRKRVPERAYVAVFPQEKLAEFETWLEV
ncbi:hypothetical protein [Parenemella sanctibonifatiensis]|nr:hypothetical protein [Parenemella sanctibonifatiensis]